MSHTQEPWRECGADSGGCACGQIWSTSADRHVATVVRKGEDADDLTDAEIKTNARRIVACVNACKGISTEKLEGPGILVNIPDDHNIIKQRDRLLEALKSVIDCYDCEGGQLSFAVYSKAVDAIAEIESAP